LNGVYFITDPVFSKRIAVPRRRTLPAFTVKEMLAFAPHVNVLLTHNHHDHLDLSSIKALPAGTRVFAPLGLRDLVRDLNRKGVKEMDWWQSADAGNGVAIHCLPAQHWSLRLLTRTNTSLWCSFMIVTDKVVIYFGGDSGYFIGYREIAKRFPKIDYAILPMGAYRPRWFMHYSHLDPEEVLKAASDLNARHVLTMHWGAFALGEEPAGFPGLDLRRLLQKNPMDSGKVIMPAIGEIIQVKD
jgi:L-ascorbate metabolism protein UlaG (beta-lactamase superfamily)